MTAAVVVAIGGSDPLGYSGLQADLRHLESLAMAAVGIPTCLTEQGEDWVSRVLPVPEDHVGAALRLALLEVTPRAIKVGLVHRAAVVHAIVHALPRSAIPLVVDPVCAASAGTSLLENGALAALVGHLFPLATVVTPNLPELAAIAALLGRKAHEDPESTARAMVQLGTRAVLLKGGHGGDPLRVVDLLVTAAGTRKIEARRLVGIPPRGTGCALSTTIAAGLAAGLPLEVAVEASLLRVRAAIRRAMTEGVRRLVL